MAKYFLGVLSGVLLVFFGVILVVFVIALASGGSAAPSIEDNTVLNVNLTGPVPERIATDFSLDIFNSKPQPTLLGLRRALERAAEDDQIRALWLRCGGLNAGWAKVQEIRWAIEEFRESGKPVIASMQVGGTLDYLAASAADEVYLAPEGFLDMKGLRAEVTFYKDMFDKIGVELEMENVGKYKSAVEPYSRTDRSDAFREVTNEMLDGMYDQLIAMLANSRGLDEGAVREALDQGPFLPAEAERLALVEGLLYEDELEARLNELLDVEEFAQVGLSAYMQSQDDLFGPSSENKVAIVYGVGSIMRGSSESDPVFGIDVLGSDSFSKTIREVRDNDDIDAVVLRINSPGGDAFASDTMWRDLRLLLDEKPVVVSMSDVAASGGYYMAMAQGAPVMAYPLTVTGSIGVFSGKLNLRGLYDKIGLSKEILTRGRFADIDTDYRSLDDTERKKLRDGIEAVYQTFVQKVADARGSSWDEIHEVAQGRVWLGTQAEANGLVDELGGFEQAIALAMEKAGIDADDDVQLLSYPAPKTFIEQIMESNRLAFAPTVPAWLSNEMRTSAPGLPALVSGGILALAPFSLTIQ